MKVSNRALIAALVAFVSLSACTSSSHRDTAMQEPSTAGHETRYDQPGEANEFYARKRLAPGMRQIPVERLLSGYQQMKAMDHYASASGQRYSSALDAYTRAPDAVLAAWSELGPGNVGGRTRAIVIDPVTPSTMYAGGVGGGVWKTTNAGASWVPVSDTMANIAVVSLAMDPTNPAILYAGTGEGSFNIDAIRGAGIFKSTDSGATWTQLAATTGSNFHYVNDLIVAPSNAQIVVAATSTGIFVSSDGGTSFTQRSTEIRCLDLAVTTITGTDTWLAGCGNFSQGKVLRSTNTTTWTQTLGAGGLDVGTMGRTAVAIRGTRAYAISTSLVPGFDRTGDGNGDYQNQLHAFFRSDDGGQTWTATVRNSDAHHGNTMLLSGYFSCATLGLGNGQGWYDIAVSIDPADSNYVWVGGVNLFRSADGGANWGRADNIHPDHHLITFHPQYDGTSNQTIYNGQDGGIYRTLNGRAAVAMLPATTGSVCTPASPVVSWGSLNNGYAVTQFYHGSAYPSGTSYFAGAQDNGINRGTDAGGPNAWSFLACGDGGYTAVDPSNTNLLYVGCQNVDIQRSVNGGSSFLNGDAGISTGEGSIFIPPFAMDPNNSQRLWFGGVRAWRSDNAAVAWTSASTTFNSGNDQVTAIAVATGNSNLVLMAGRSGSSRIHRTTTATTATSATAWTSTAVNGYVAALAFAPSDSNIAYAAISTFGAPHVLKSIDGGATWSNASGALPDVPALAIVVHPSDPNRVYVGTDIGVFVTLDGGSNWAAELTSFPNVSTESLQIIGTGNAAQLFAFTHGRGAFKLSLAAGPGTLGFAQSAQNAGEGATAQISVIRTSGSDGAVAVSYQTNNGTASAPGDYTTTTGTLNWAAGDATAKTISVPIISDGMADAGETFTVTLSAPTNGATLGTSTHTITILDPEVFPANCAIPAGYVTPGDGSVAWVVAMDSVQEGACSLRSPSGMGNSTNARIQTSGTFTAGNITFYSRVSSEAGWDCFRFLIDGVRQNIGNSCNSIGGLGISGESAWQQHTVAITAGAHTVTWSYEKDNVDLGGADAAWIDLVSLPLAPVNTPPVFTSAAPAGGTFGVAYTHTYTASGSPAPTFALQSGSFPPGLTLSGAVLSGTPTQAGTFTGSVRASNTAGNVDQAFSITIAAVVPGAPTLSGMAAGDTSATASFSAPASNGGAAIIDYTVSCTPGPITATGAVSPITVTGMSNGTLYSCTVRARNSVGSGPVSNAVGVTPAAATVAPVFTSTAPAAGTFGVAYTHTYTASGSPAPTFALQSGSFPPGLTLSGAVLSGTPTQAGTFTGSVRASNTAGNVDQAFSITIAAVVPGAPTLSGMAAGDTAATATFSAPASNGGAAIIDYTVSCTPGPITATGAASPITVTGMSNGTLYSCTVRARNSVGSGPVSNAVGVTPTAASVAPLFTSAAPGAGTLGVAYTHTFTASGTPAPTFALQTGSFPNGLTLTGATLSGTPSQLGTFTGSVRASNTAGNVDQAFSITISSEVFPPNCAFPVDYTTPGGSSAWVVTSDSVQEGSCSLRSPTGLAHSSTARIQTTGNFSAGNVTFFARVSSEPTFDCFRFLVDGTPAAIASNCTGTANSAGVSGESTWQQYTVPISAGVHTLAWSYEKDGSDTGGSDRAWIDLVSLPPTQTATVPAFTSSAPAGGTFGVAYNHTFTASGTPAPSFALQSGSFPPGVTLSGALLSGTPTQAGTFTGSVRASNTAGNVDQAFSITIAAVVPGAPVLNSLSAGNGSATAGFSVPASNGGAAVIDYTVSCTPGPITSTGGASPIVVSGLANGTQYSCSVSARNSVGSGAPSNAMNVTPAAAVDPIFANGFE